MTPTLISRQCILPAVRDMFQYTGAKCRSSIAYAATDALDRCVRLCPVKVEFVYTATEYRNTTTMYSVYQNYGYNVSLLWNYRREGKKREREALSIWIGRRLHSK